jgi:hypothetical protein
MNDNCLKREIIVDLPIFGDNVDDILSWIHMFNLHITKRWSEVLKNQ